MNLLKDKIVNFLEAKYGDEMASEIYKIALCHYNSVDFTAAMSKLDSQAVLSICGTLFALAKAHFNQRAEDEVTSIVNEFGSFDDLIDGDDKNNKPKGK